MRGGWQAPLTRSCGSTRVFHEAAKDRGSRRQRRLASLSTNGHWRIETAAIVIRRSLAPQCNVTVLRNELLQRKTTSG
jgi:hypothetical protein